jgi:hypothetical protein
MKERAAIKVAKLRRRIDRGDIPRGAEWNFVWSSNLQALDELRMIITGAVGWKLERWPSGRLFRPGIVYLEMLEISGQFPRARAQ